MIFAGTFKQQKLGELQDLAWALDLDQTGNKSNILERMTAHFDLPANAALKNDARYTALFGKRKRTNEDSGAEPVAGPSTVIPPRTPQRRRLDEVGNFISSPSRRSPHTPPPVSQAATFYAPPQYSFAPPPHFFPPPAQYPPIPPFHAPVAPSTFFYQLDSSQSR
ncbi:hypothetical protein R3P38DRAFT_2573518 [Favolaschia claudopus]|uniref:SAP domain-containing protein n=1 Tax=Favolaschia claudopus TaxID=2862362 RepID=A0AAV9ZPA6_9AGAR